MKKLFALLLGVALVAPAAFAAPSPKASTTLSAGDKAFMNAALQGNMLEIQLGKVAEQNGSGKAKAFGQQMVTDHTKLLASTEKVAREKGMQIPAALDATGQAAVKKYQALKGDAFNTAYLKDMQEDHTKDVAAFKKEEQTTKDPQIKALVASALPVIESHLKMVNTDMGSASGSSKSTGATKSK